MDVVKVKEVSLQCHNVKERRQIARVTHAVPIARRITQMPGLLAPPVLVFI